jgi:hypothetical protein
MGGCSADTPSDGLESLLDIDHQAALDRGNINPFAILIQNLQTARVVLRQERK